MWQDTRKLESNKKVRKLHIHMYKWQKIYVCFGRVRLRSGKLELVSTRKDGFFDAGDMPEHSSGLFFTFFHIRYCGTLLIWPLTCSVLAKKLGCWLKIKLTWLKEGVKLLMLSST